MLRKESHEVGVGDFDDADNAVKETMKLWRAFEFSVTPKVHILECHAVKQMRQFGGIGQYSEDFVEQCHQLGLKHRKLTSHTLNLRVAFRSEAQAACLANKKEVRKIVQEVNDSATRKRKSEELPSVVKKRMQKAARDESRKQCVDEVAEAQDVNVFKHGLNFLCAQKKEHQDKPNK